MLLTTSTVAGVHLEKLTGASDRRAHSIRIDDHYRGIVVAPERGDLYILVKVLDHDAAYRWAKRNRFGVNATTGALEVIDVVAFDDAVAAASQKAQIPSRESIFAGNTARDFTRLGIDERLREVLFVISTEAQLESLTSSLPQGQADALWMPASGFSADEAWLELTAGEEPGAVDVDDVDAALARPASKATFHLASGTTDVSEALSRPFDVWPTPMTNAELIIEALQTHGPLTDAQLRVATGVEPHQQVNQICRRLEMQGVLRRVRGVDGRILNELTDTAPKPNLPALGDPG